MGSIMIEIGENLLTAIIMLATSTVVIAMFKYVFNVPKIVEARKKGVNNDR